VLEEPSHWDTDQNNQQSFSPTPSVAASRILLFMQLSMIVASLSMPGCLGEVLIIMSLIEGHDRCLMIITHVQAGWN